KSRFNLWDHDSRIRVRRYAGERCLPEFIIERHRGLTSGIMAWGTISYHGRSNLLRIECNLNSNRYVFEVLQPEFVPYSPDMSPFHQVWDLVGRRLARDQRPAASKDELLL
ncbi:transposable element Tc1 transposase, partial [Trichonephila clavipes]